jgi:subtilisin family serine protease
MKTTRDARIAACLVAAAALSPALAQESGGKIQDALLETMASRRAIARPAEEPVQHRVMVLLERPEGMSAEAAMDYSSAGGMARIQRGVDAMQEKVLSQRLEGSYKPLYRYESVFGFSALADDAAIRALAELPDVERIEILPIYYKASNESHPLAAVGGLHDMGFTGDGSTNPVIDDGIDHDHAAFGGQAAFPNPKIIGGREFADDDDDPTIDCVEQSHGTAVAGVAAGNGGGVLGTAPDARLVMLKVQSAMLCGQPGLDGDLVGASDWAVTHRDDFGIRVISMSLGAGGFTSVGSCEASSTGLRDAVDAATAAGLVVLAASGNDGLCDRISRPACIGNAISVGAVYDADVGTSGFCVSANACDSEPHPVCAMDGRRACFDTTTNEDQVTCYSNSATFLDVLAPSNCALTAAAGGGNNDCFGGTSSATPFAAGVAASLIEADGGLDNTGLRDLLVDTGVVVRDAKSGLDTPRIDATAALADLVPPCPPSGLSEDFESGLGDWQATGLWHAAADSVCAPAGFSAAAYYGRDAGCDYETAGANSGTLTSPEITGLTAASTLSFDYLRQVESFAGGSFDRTVVEVVVGGVATEVFSRDSTDPSTGAASASGPVSLAAFAGQTIRLRFRFDSMDGIANGFRGWHVDDVVVTGSAMCGP